MFLGIFKLYCVLMVIDAVSQLSADLISMDSMGWLWSSGIAPSSNGLRSRSPAPTVGPPLVLITNNVMLGVTLPVTDFLLNVAFQSALILTF